MPPHLTQERLPSVLTLKLPLLNPNECSNRTGFEDLLGHFLRTDPDTSVAGRMARVVTVVDTVLREGQTEKVRHPNFVQSREFELDFIGHQIIAGWRRFVFAAPGDLRRQEGHLVSVNN